MSRANPRYGWLPDLPDARDQLYAAPPHVVAALPPAVDLRPQCPAVVDQGQLGSCTANAIGSAYRYDVLRQGGSKVFAPSRLFIYYNERAMEGTTGSDSGAMIRDGIKSLVKQGTCSEKTWPYNIARFAVRPPPKAYTEALKHQAVSYARVTRTLPQLKGCVAAGFPFVFGFTVYESFESQEVADTGVVPMPGPGEAVLGGHAVLAVGYADATRRIRVMNSWGTAWGDRGYFTMPYEYFTSRGLSSDFWVVRTVEG
jgi:C1A family cysteine protease